MDLWSLFDFLMPGFLGTERQVCYSFPSLLIQKFMYFASLDCMPSNPTKGKLPKNM